MKSFAKPKSQHEPTQTQTIDTDIKRKRMQTETIPKKKQQQNSKNFHKTKLSIDFTSRSEKFRRDKVNAVGNACEISYSIEI